jgi:PPOX class probable F420-dependent enzyme
VRLDDGACWQRLGGSGHGTLGTLHPVRGVDLVPVVFVVDAPRLVIPVDAVKPKAGPRLQRATNLAADPRCSLLVEHYDEDWSALWWVRAHAHGREAAPDAAVLERLGDAFAPYRAPGAVTSVLVLTVDAVTGWAADTDR